jgi:DNA-binding PadR family transcriptional regulator
MHDCAARSVLQMKKGFMRLFIMGMLYREPLHGMAIMQRIAAGTKGFWDPKAGNLYPLLKELHAEGLVEYDPSEPGRKKTYMITEQGKHHLLALLEAPPRIMSHVSRGSDSYMQAGPVPLYAALLKELDPEGRRERLAHQVELLDEAQNHLKRRKRELKRIIDAGDGPESSG